MELWREQLVNLLLLGILAMAAGAAIMVLHGLLIHHRSGQPIRECVTNQAGDLIVVAVLSTLLLLTQAKTVPWDWLGTLTLLVATAPVMLTWLGPPDEHMAELCQIGKGSAYSHYHGYLRLMQGPHGIRTRLGAFKTDNPNGLSEDELRDFYSRAVVVLAPTDGKYPGSFTELNGVGKQLCVMPNFEISVGGNKRPYGAFRVYEVTSSGGRKRYVALEKVGALETLQKLRQYGPAGLSKSDCMKQMKDMMDELEKIVADSDHLRGQLKVVRYTPGEHVGDAIMTAVEEGRD